MVVQSTPGDVTGGDTHGTKVKTRGCLVTDRTVLHENVHVPTIPERGRIWEPPEVTKIKKVQSLPSVLSPVRDIGLTDPR